MSHELIRIKTLESNAQKGHINATLEWRVENPIKDQRNLVKAQKKINEFNI